MTYEEMFDSWTGRLKAMSDEERRALRDAVDEIAEEGTEGLADSKFFAKFERTSLSLPYVYIDIVPPKD